MIGVEKFPDPAWENGFYSVNGVPYSNKISAVLEAQKTLADITWDFHNDSFKKANWLVEPDIGLDNLYQLRAQQIRDAYDYVIIMCSGGADSTNVIKTFLNNNIHVDEVIASAPMEGLKNWNWNDKDTSASNTMSETKFALFPLLHEITVNYPKVKITINDFFQDIINSKTDDWLYKCPDWITPIVTGKGDLNKFTHLKNLADQGKRIAVVWGCDKPIMRYDQDGNMYSLITDLGVNNAVMPFDNCYPNVNRILFYWAPDFPELLVKQSHVVAKFVHRKENFWLVDAIKKLGSTKFWEDKSPTDNTIINLKGDYQRGIVPAIYPTTVTPVFQCQKSTVAFLPPQSTWFDQLHKGTKISQLLESDFKLFYKSINPLYLSTQKTGFKLFLQRYKIGHYKQFLEPQL
jgi:hypothetical protein